MKNSTITFRWVVDQNKVETSTIKIGKVVVSDSIIENCRIK